MVTIYLAGIEDTSIVATGSTIAVSTTAADFRSGWGREAITVSVGSATDPPSPRFTTSLWSTAVSSFWLHAQTHVGVNASNTTLNNSLLRFLDPSGIARLMIRGTGTTGELKISKRNSAGTFTDLVTMGSALWSGALRTLDVQVVYGVSGSVTLYLNNSQVLTYSGDVTTDSNTTLQQVDFANCSTGTFIAWSEIIVSDSNTIGAGVWTLAPSGTAQGTQGWTGVVASIDETTISDAASISEGSVNVLTQWSTNNTVPTGAWSPVAVVQDARVAVGVSGPQNFAFSLFTNSATSNSSQVSPSPTTSFANFSNNIWATNPNTSASWVLSDISSGFSAGLKSLT